MVWFLTKKDLNSKFRQLNYFLTESFTKVKKDTTNIFQWIDYFHKKSMQQEHLIKQLQLELQYTPKTPTEVRKVVDNHYSFENIHKRIDDINRKIEFTEYKTPVSETLKQKLDEINRKIETIEQQKSSVTYPKISQTKEKVRERIVKKITQNSKNYIKNLIIALIRKYENITGPQLKEIVVDEQGLCSKSSFYRLLSELEEDKDVSIVKEGKEKRYFTKILQKQ